jgi:hypothetical protein
LTFLLAETEIVTLLLNKIFKTFRFSSKIPITFMVGFYVANVVSRYWDQFISLPWPDRIAFKLVGYLPGQVTPPFSFPDSPSIVPGSSFTGSAGASLLISFKMFWTSFDGSSFDKDRSF